jgi:GT2 family glycosyltransferase
MRYSIIIPSYKKLYELLEPCLNSIKTYTSGDFEVIVVANGCSKQELESVISAYPMCKTLWFEKALGYAKAVNEGIKVASGEYIILLNDDTELLPQTKNYWLDLLVEPFTKDPSVGISGPLLDVKKIAGYQFLVFFLVMIPKSLFDTIGLLGEEFTVGGGEDADFCIRAQKAGYKLVEVCPNPVHDGTGTAVGGFPIYHKSGRTVSMVKDWKQVFNSNMNKVQNKYERPDFTDLQVAVVMPVCLDNNEKLKLFEKAVNGVLSQTFPNVTLIIVNDGPDVHQLRQYDSSVNVKVLSTNEPYSKPAAGRNKALEYILKSETGYDLVAFCDGDDIWDPNHLTDSIATLIQSGANAVCSTPRFRDPRNQAMTPYGIPIDQPVDFKNTGKQNSIYISSVVLWKDTVQKVGMFDTKMNGIEDWDYWLTLLEKGYSFTKKLETSLTYTVYHGSNALNTTQKTRNDLIMKHALLNTNKEIKLNLGCGDERLEGYINCDLYDETADEQFDAISIPYADNTVDEIRAYHLIEHFTFQGAMKALREWYRVLKPGGRVVMETPDLYHACKTFVDASPSDRIKLYGHFFAWPDISPGQVHYFLYTEEQMMWTLSELGFVNARRERPDSGYAKSNPHWEPIYLKVVAFKPN